MTGARVNPDEKPRELQAKIKVFKTPNTFKLAFEVEIDDKKLITDAGHTRRFQTHEAAIKAAILAERDR